MGVEYRMWLPSITLGRSEKTGDYVVVRYGTTKGSGVHSPIGRIVPVQKAVMQDKGLELLLKHLCFFREWSANTEFNSELAGMDSTTRRRFIKDHLLIGILQRRDHSISLCPNHRNGGTWRKVESYVDEEIEIPINIRQKQFLAVLDQVFSLSD